MNDGVIRITGHEKNIKKGVDRIEILKYYKQADSHGAGAQIVRGSRARKGDVP